MDKQQCIKQKAVANIIQERRLLEEVWHPLTHFFLFVYLLYRSTTPSWSTFDMLSRMMIIVSSSSTSCSVAIFDVGFLFHSSWELEG
jgi:hypothetical protein